MTFDRAQLKQNAKDGLRQSKPSPILVALVYLLIVFILEYLSGRVTGSFDNIQLAIQALLEGQKYYTPVQPKILGSLLSIAISLMSMIIGVGFSLFALNVSRMKKAGFGNLFDAFGFFGKALWLQILMAIFIWLWSLLLIIPGIIAAYRYRQAVYIMLDNPDMSALECISASKQLMQGRKWELFVLDWSFILWYLLCMIPVFYIWVAPYYEVTCANFYNALIGPQYQTGAPPVYDYREQQQRDPWDPER